MKDKSAKTRNCRCYWMMTQLNQRYRQQCLIWITHWSKSNRNEPRDMEKWYCYTTMPRLIWRHLTITSSHQWDTRLQSSTLAISKNCKNGSTNVLAQNKNSFSGEVFIRWSKYVEADGQSFNKRKMKFPWKLFVFFFYHKTLKYLWVHLLMFVILSSSSSNAQTISILFVLFLQ